MRLTRRIVIAAFVAIILLVLFALVSPAFAQRTGGSFGGSAWGNRSTPTRSTPRTAAPSPTMRVASPSPRINRATRSDTSTTSTVRLILPIARAAWRARPPQTPPSRVVIARRPSTVVAVPAREVSYHDSRARDASCAVSPRSASSRFTSALSALAFVAYFCLLASTRPRRAG